MKRLIALLLLALIFTAGCDIAGISITTTSQAPLINSFVADPPSISAGESSTLSWSVTGATMVSIDQGIGNVSLTGNRAVMPSTTTVYTLTAKNAAGVSATATAQVIVSGAITPAPTPGNLPVVNYFTANPSAISAGGSTTLSWNVSNATSVNIQPGVGTVSSTGTISLSPLSTTTYTLMAINMAGSKTTTTQVAVSGIPSPYPPTGLPVVNYFTANPPIISAGGSTTLSWNVSNATAVTIDPGVGPVSSVGTTLVSPTTSTNYTLTATNAAGWWTKGTTVLVSGMPSPPSFAVTSVTASVDPPSYSGACPTTLYAQAVITVNGPGTVTYRWEDSEGGHKPTENVYFSSAGSQSVNTSWPVGKSGSLWVRVHVFTPNETVSNQASFILTCTSAPATGWAGTWSTNWGKLVLIQSGNQVTGNYEHDNGHITGAVLGNFLRGTWSEAPSYSPPNDAGDVEWTMSPDGNSFTGYWRYGSSGGWSGSWTGTRIQ